MGSTLWQVISMEVSMQDATESGVPNLYASEDHISAIRGQQSWIKNWKKSRIRQNVPENIPIWALPGIWVMQLKID